MIGRNIQAYAAKAWALFLGIARFSSSRTSGSPASDKNPSDKERRQMEEDGKAACADTVPIEALRLEGGEIADVRVLRHGDTLLYIPSSWFTRTAFAETFRPGERSSDALEPLLSRDEGPGRIHDVPVGGRVKLFPKIPETEESMGGRFPVRSILLQTLAGGPIHSGSVDYGPPDEHGWAQQGQGTSFVDTLSPRDKGSSNGVTSSSIASVRMGYPMDSSPNSSGIVFQEDVQAGYSWLEESAPQPQWRQLRARMGRLMAWLSKPPSQRNRNEIF
jgi:hypothetical protein